MQGSEAVEQDHDPDRLQPRLTGIPQAVPPSRQATDDCFLDFQDDDARQEIVCFDVRQHIVLAALEMCVGVPRM